MSEPSDVSVLSGFRVVELTMWIAGPSAGGIMADWGADVIKVEPTTGDPQRNSFRALGYRDDLPNPGFGAGQPRQAVGRVGPRHAGGEARTKRIHRNLPGQALQLVALTISGLETYGRDNDKDPGNGETRAAYAAWQLRRGEGVLWPPHRNDLCWCRSGLKYKRCCGPVPAAAETSRGETQPAAPDGQSGQSSGPVEQLSGPPKQL